MHDVQIDPKGRTALVTGSPQGIGAAIATGPARAGARVAVDGRSTERVRDSAAALQREVPGADVVPVAADVTPEAGAEALPRVGVSSSTTSVSSVPRTRWGSPTTSGGAPSRWTSWPRCG